MELHAEHGRKEDKKFQGIEDRQQFDVWARNY